MDTVRSILGCILFASVAGLIAWWAYPYIFGKK